MQYNEIGRHLQSLIPRGVDLDTFGNLMYRCEPNQYGYTIITDPSDQNTGGYRITYPHFDYDYQLQIPCAVDSLVIQKTQGELSSLNIGNEFPTYPDFVNQFGFVIGNI